MWTPGTFLPTLGLGNQLHLKLQTLTIYFFVHSFIHSFHKHFFSIYYVPGMVVDSQVTDYAALGSLPSSRRQVCDRLSWKYDWEL